MSLINYIEDLFSTSSKQSKQTNRYPIYDEDFVHSITWRCANCGEEFYWLEDERHLVCHHCETQYSLSEDDFPELLRAKCWNCGEISDEIGGFRMENIVFDCPHCEFQWKSSRH